MERSSRHYHVFISYRHNDRDKRIAEELQRRLEKYKVQNPETGQMEWLTVFRDQSELPTSNDLGRDIEMALENSDYLVLICSRDYQKSIWCMRELSYFRSLHNNSNARILPIIAEGEPAECFPPEICFREEVVYNGESLKTVRIPVEPMAADVRGATLSEQIKKLRSTEYMRIAAPVLGVPFDALYQRRARSRFQKILAAISAAFVLAVGFGLYNFSVNQKLTAQQQEILKADSKNLARTAQLLMEKGQRKQALETVLQAFPSETQNRPIVPEAVQTLHEAMYTYHASGYRVNQVYESYYAIQGAVLSEDGKYLVTIESNRNMICYDLQKQDIHWRIELETHSAVGDPELILLPMGDAILLIDSFEPYLQGTLVSRISIVSGETEWTRNIGEHHPVVSPDRTMLTYVITNSDDITGVLFEAHILDTQTGNEIKAIKFSPEETHLMYLGAFGFSEDGENFFLVTERESTTDQQFAALTVYDLNGEKIDTAYTVKAGAYMHNTVLGKKYSIDIFPIADAHGETCGYYYKVSILGEILIHNMLRDNINEGNTILLTGAVFTDKPEKNFRCPKEFPFERNGLSKVSADYLGAFPFGQDIVFITANQMVKYNHDNESNLFCQKDFPSPAICCFSQEGEVFVVFQDGTISKVTANNTYPMTSRTQQGVITSNGCSMATIPSNDSMVLISRGDQRKAMICQKIGDFKAKEAPFENPVYLHSLFSENSLAIISKGKRLHMSFIDIQNMNIQTQSQEYSGGVEFRGITADKKIAILDDCIWDLNTNSIISSTDYPWQRNDLSDISFLASGNRILKKRFERKQTVPPVLQWWYNGCPIDVPTTYQGKPILDKVVFDGGADAVQSSAFLIGQNGLLVARVNFSDNYSPIANFSYSGLLVFSAEDKIWRYVPRDTGAPLSESDYPYCAFAREHPWIGIPERDGVLRVYDWNTDSYIFQCDLQLPGALVCFMSFFGNDRYALLATSEKIVIIELETGKKVLEEPFETYRKAAGLLPILCTEFGDYVSLCLNKDGGYGLCINTKTWQVENRIPDLLYMDDSVVLSLNPGQDRLSLYPRWNTEDLLAAARQELREYTSE